MESFPLPKSKTDVRAFLGLASYYQRFIKDFADIAKPLTGLTKMRGNPKSEWSEIAQNAFSSLKAHLINPPTLSCPHFKSPYILQTSASNSGLCVALAQGKDGKEVVIAYASRQLKDSERKYATLEKECLAIVWGIRYFHYFQYGPRHFAVVTNHCPLQRIKKMEPKNQMIQRWICEIQGYSFSVRHRKGSTNANADALSRCPISSGLEENENCIKGWSIRALELVDISLIQDRDEEIKEMKDYLLNHQMIKECVSSMLSLQKSEESYFITAITSWIMQDF